ncbi:MAG TPA: HD domain-containing protein [Armatimonadota bacterium]|nr:HD domain-containing protein [Armatimonadota bacterium]
MPDLLRPEIADAVDAADATLLADLVDAMEARFGDDSRRIAHALKVLDRAQEILAHEQADVRVVFAAAVLHDIGIQEAERKHGSSAGGYQEIEGPPIARPIMEGLGMGEDTVDHVCRIIANHHSARDIDTPEFRVIWDADWLVNLPDDFGHLAHDKLCELAETVFKTPTGHRLGQELMAEMA